MVHCRRPKQDDADGGAFRVDNNMLRTLLWRPSDRFVASSSATSMSPLGHPRPLTSLNLAELPRGDSQPSGRKVASRHPSSR